MGFLDCFCFVSGWGFQKSPSRMTLHPSPAGNLTKERAGKQVVIHCRKRTGRGFWPRSKRSSGRGEGRKEAYRLCPDFSQHLGPKGSQAQLSLFSLPCGKSRNSSTHCPLWLTSLSMPLPQANRPQGPTGELSGCTVGLPAPLPPHPSPFAATSPQPSSRGSSGEKAG